MLAVLFLQTLTGGGTRRACELGSQPPGLQHRLVGYRMRKCWRSSSLMVSAKHSQKYFLLASANTVMYTLWLHCFAALRDVRSLCDQLLQVVDPMLTSTVSAALPSSPTALSRITPSMLAAVTGVYSFSVCTRFFVEFCTRFHSSSISYICSKVTTGGWPSRRCGQGHCAVKVKANS